MDKGQDELKSIIRQYEQKITDIRLYLENNEAGIDNSNSLINGINITAQYERQNIDKETIITIMKSYLPNLEAKFEFYKTRL